MSDPRSLPSQSNSGAGRARLRAGIRRLTCPALFLLILACVCYAQGPQPQPSPQQAKAPVKDAADYVGSAKCQECHGELFKGFEETAHWKTMRDKRGHAFQGCEGCHGPGREHAEKYVPGRVIAIRMLSPREVVDRCLNCHQLTEEHGNFRRSAHNTGNVSCLDCHSQHLAKQKQYLLRASQPQLCYGCHAETKSEFARPFRHRVQEGLLKCTDCHNQHGGFFGKLLRSRETQESACGKCHIEKAGAFVFEHLPVKAEGCESCHVPHGSANPRMLKRSQVNLLCLECHTFSTFSAARGTPGFHNQAREFQACTMCHVAVHGSNSSRFFFK